MKTIMVMIVTLALAGTLNATALELGDGIPSADVKMKNVDGTEITLAGIRGEKGTLVLFSCNHCPFVKAWEARIATLGNESRENGIGVVQVNSNDPQKEIGRAHV